MSIFSRKAKQPQPIQAQPETVKTVETVYICASCGKEGAKYQLEHPVSYFGYVRLQYVFLCKECDDKRIEADCNHHNRMRKDPLNTDLRLKAIDIKKMARQA